MGGSQSREGVLEESESEEEEEEEEEEPESQEQHQEKEEQQQKEASFYSPMSSRLKHPQQNGAQNLSLEALSLQNKPSMAKLYHHIGGNTPRARWVVAEKLVPWEFLPGGDGDAEDEDEEEDDNGGRGRGKQFRSWVLRVGSRIQAVVEDRLQAKFFDDQLRVDFVFQGVWALKFLTAQDYRAFVAEFHNCAFENTYLMAATEENKVKLFGKDFLGWVKPEDADDSIWEDAEEVFDQSTAKDLRETYSEVLNEGVQSLTMGALDHSFLVSDCRIEAFRNTATGIQGKGASFQFQQRKIGESDSFMTPKKAMLIRGESNMLILSPSREGKPHASGVRQLDVESGKMVAEWKFEKDGTDITMRDVINESKGAQLDPSLSTFLGLDDNRLCRWDMRDRHGIVQQLATPTLNWAEGHQFSRGTNFQCFASTGDGCVVVGSKDGKIRLYSTSSMRQAKTAFPGLGSPITHVDVTFDGKWVLGTTETYMILISTVFKDKDGKTKTGFTERMGNRIAAPRLLKLTPVDAHLAGKDHKFHGGQFSWVTESGKTERHLVVTVGNFTVIWDFRRVKQSDHECYRYSEGLKTCNCYKIVPKEESIVDSKFMHDKFSCSYSPEAPLVVATPKNISSFNV